MPSINDMGGSREQWTATQEFRLRSPSVEQINRNSQDGPFHSHEFIPGLAGPATKQQIAWKPPDRRFASDKDETLHINDWQSPYPKAADSRQLGIKKINSMYRGKSDMSGKDQRVGSQAASHRSMNLDINVVIVDN